MSEAIGEPNAAQFDPFGLAYWTLPMALAWIIWRTPEAVQSQWNQHDFHFRDLSRTADGSLAPSGLKSLHDLLLTTEYDEFDKSSVWVRGPNACDDLWSKLGSGKLVATGIEAASQKRSPIVAIEWQDLDSFDPGLGWPFDSVGEGHKHKLRYSSVSVPQSEVKGLWPSICDSGVSKPVAKDISFVETTVPKSRGRRTGEGSFESLDAPLMMEMRQLIADGKAASPEEAARQVASRAHGGGTDDSKAERLARRYRKAQRK